MQTADMWHTLGQKKQITSEFLLVLAALRWFCVDRDLFLRSQQGHLVYIKASSFSWGFYFLQVFPEEGQLP